MKDLSDWQQLILYVLAGIGLMYILHRIDPCERKNNCDPSATYDAADNQW